MSAARADQWLSLAISDIAVFGSGDLISVARLSARSGSHPVPVYGGNGIAGYTSLAMVDQPTVILGRVGQKCGVVYRNDGPAWITDNALYARRFKRLLDVRFLAFALEAARLNDVKNKNDLPLITQSILNDVKIAWPDSLEEQRRIAGAVRDIDNLIASLELMINKKCEIKQGLMQQLLTGRTRLPGFTDPWRRVEVRELLEFRNGLNKESSFFGSGTPIVNFMDVMNGPVISAGDVTGRVTLTRDEIKRFSARKGDLFFTRTSETVDEVGTAAALVEHVSDAVFSGFVLRGRPRVRDLDAQFLAYLFQVDAIRRQVESTASYTTRALTNGRALGRVVVDIPILKEQRAISRVLTEVDAEIEALHARVTKSKAVKRGMTQELLTGRKRLPVKGETEA
ncbi:restriction endonuclease subunit S [Streptomyces violaceorubidus]|uniref:restriction endonuclease subunit S n=1 Tax=Streptomyces violaceorubidus TaxID=284042 RepID=UPI001428D22E|nr:restriction endonuclease subunit S [Streptomyces violaceorubidus]